MTQAQWIFFTVVVVYVVGLIACRLVLETLIHEDPEYIDNEMLDTFKAASSMIWFVFIPFYAIYLLVKLAKSVKSKLAPKKA